MTKTTRRDTCPTSAGTLKRVCLALVVLLLASAALVGVGSADDASTPATTPVAKIGDTPYDTLDAAINAVVDNTPTTIEIIADDTYTLPNSIIGKDITITGDKNVVIEILTAVNAGNSNITFDNVTVKFDNDNYEGLQHSKKVVYQNCVINGTQFMYAPVVEFTNCVFGKYNADTEYNVWTYGSTDVTFTDCTFYTGGKAILVYNENTDDTFVANIKLKNCHFYGDGKFTDRAAVEAGQTPYGVNTYIITIEDCTAEGFTANNSPSPLLGNKNSMNFEHLVGYINGEEVTKPTIIDVSTITLGDDKVYDGQALTRTGDAVVYDYNNRPLNNITIDYEWLKDGISVSNPKDVGTYYLKASIQSRPDINATTSNSVTINPATVIITPVALTKASGDPETLTYTSSSPVSGEYSKVEGTLSRSVTSEKMGTYVIDGINNLELVDNGTFTATNYKLELNSTLVYLTITPKVLPADGASDEYNAILASSENESTLKDKIAISYGNKFTETYFIEVSLLDASGQPDSTTETTFIVTYASLGISEADAKKADFVVLHLLSNGETEEIKAEAVADGLKIGPTTTSPFAIGYTVKQTPTGSSSSSSGSSVWLTETPTPTETPTEKPTDAVPTDIPSTQPTETPESPAFGALAALAGLGAVAVLRRE